MSDSSRRHIPPYLPDLIGVNEVAEAAFEQEGGNWSSTTARPWSPGVIVLTG